MGRSVSYPADAIVAFTTFDCEDPDDASFEWDWFVDDLRDRLSAVSSTFRHQDTWIGREDHVLASNGHAHFGVSEYCGLVSVWLVARDDLEPRQEALAARWLEQVRDRFVATYGTLRKLGTMSNGEGVYERLAQPQEA